MNTELYNGVVDHMAKGECVLIVCVTVTYKKEMETLQQGEQPLPQVSLTDLEGKIQELETFGDRVVLSMESAAVSIPQQQQQCVCHPGCSLCPQTLV